jgi:hypothetical protein
MQVGDCGPHPPNIRRKSMVVEHLFQSVKVSLREMRMRLSNNAQRRVDVRVHAVNRVLEAAEHAGVDISGNTLQGRGIHVREIGQ